MPHQLAIAESLDQGLANSLRQKNLTAAGRFVHDKGMILSYLGRQKERMPTTRKAITFSMPPEMAEQVQQVLKEEGRTMSEFLREAIRLYMQERAWLRQERRQRAEARRNDQE